MKQNTNKKIPYIPVPQVLQHIAPTLQKKSKKQSNFSNNSTKNINDISNNKSNSKHKISRLQTNQSNHQQTTSMLTNPKLSPTTKRFKTQLKSNRQHTNTSQTSLHKQIITKRLRTDQTDRMQSPSINLLKIQDDYNATSIAQLLQFHTGYHDIDQEEFNYRVRKQTEGSRMGEQKQQKIQSSQKSNSIVQVQIQDNQKNQQEEQQVQQQQQNQQKIDQRSQSNTKSKNKQLNQQKLNKKQNKSIRQKKYSSQDDQQLISSSVYQQGQIVGQSTVTLVNTKKQQPNFKKKKQIRSYSHEDKLKIIAQNKYVPKNEQQLRMEARYVKGQIKKIHELRQLEEMKKFMSQYQNNKKLILQQSTKKLQISKMMNNMKKINKLAESTPVINIKKSLSLPKIKPPYQQIVLPDPDTQPTEALVHPPQLTNTINNYKKYENSLSGTRFHYQLKKQTSLQLLKNKQKQKIYTQVQNVEHIQNVLRSKGIQFDVNAIRKGLMSVRIKTQVDGSETNGFGIEYPKKLISNPKYQKYPL